MRALLGRLTSSAGRRRPRPSSGHQQQLPHPLGIRSMGGETYYDSQSGRHVAVHDENKIFAYLGRLKDMTAPSSSAVKAARKMGFAGLVTPPDESDDDVAALVASLAQANDDGTADFTTFLRLPPRVQLSDLQRELPHFPPPANFCFEYRGDALMSMENDIATIDAATHGRTSLGIFDPTIYTDEDPIAVAAGVATLIDRTGGGSHILLAPTGDEEVAEDDMVRLCEELSYVDIPGSTMKSRLIVSALGEEQLEECLGMGISKYIVEDESGLERLRDAVEGEGKELVLNEII